MTSSWDGSLSCSHENNITSTGHSPLLSRVPAEREESHEKLERCLCE